METIGMVLVQEDEEIHEHVIYYLSWNLIDAEIRYSHVEKLALATVHAVQRLRHYILLRQTLVVAHVNPFQFILTRRMIGGKYNKWIVILQEFDLEFVLVKSMRASPVDQYPITLVHIVGFKIIKNRTNILQVLGG